ncbi:hypothetical protein PAT3040_04107 [Paenibacillus agaridevorans]|uniref:Uncharacterized protein n=1 Tax=Paenibacillus agaridevorans TaxID=171404 RepID=A0A2R5F158_9BACL|nr:hypothetical protein [Paenibacillus agaridevorans]GBG09461.1 hypothetical protein PAT3040_04107 [Paenibacillus agaridevorans]
MRYRIQVERGPMTKIVIFRLDENSLPDNDKTFFTEAKMGLLGQEDPAALLSVDDLYIEDKRVAVNLTKYQARTGRPAPPSYQIPADEFRAFLKRQNEAE